MRTLRALERVLLAALLIAVAGLTWPSPASAHTALTASDPADGATLSAGPSRVSATFNEEPQAAFAAMTVVGPDGNLWSDGVTEVRGTVVSVGLRPLGPSGRYTVNYRVTSQDGHVVTGSWGFAVTLPGTGEPGTPVAESDSRIPLWPFVVGAGLLILPAVAWGARRRG